VSESTSAPVVLYTTTNCNKCRLTRAYLLEHHIPFQEISIFRQGGAADELVQLTGALAAPVVIVGRKFIRGYRPDALHQLLMDEGYMSAGP
jgi:glutaredoxin